jgi:hypothetical protein
LGLAFVSVWVMAVLSASILSFVNYSKQIIINNDGILCKTILNEKLVNWSDIKDWGISYCGQSRGQGNTYDLYFSEHECKVKNECRKKLKGKMMKIYVFQDDYSEVVSEIIPFCSEKTNVKPFIGKDKYHFI